MNTGDGLQRMDWSYFTRPIVEETINKALPIVKNFEWTWDDDKTRSLDELNGIDLICRLKGTKQPLTCQIKVLAQCQYQTITVETKNSYTGSEGDWQNDLSQYLVCIYSSEGTDVKRWAVIDQGRLRIATVTNNLIWQQGSNSRSNAKSDFKYIPFSEVLEFAPECVFAYGGDWSLDESEEIKERRIN